MATVKDFLHSVGTFITGFLQDRAPTIHAFVMSEAGQAKIRHGLSVLATSLGGIAGLQFSQDTLNAVVNLAFAAVIEACTYAWSQYAAKKAAAGTPNG